MVQGDGTDVHKKDTANTHRESAQALGTDPSHYFPFLCFGLESPQTGWEILQSWMAGWTSGTEVTISGGKYKI